MVYKLFYEHVAKSGNVILFWLDEYSKGALKMHQTAHIRLVVNKASARHRIGIFLDTLPLHIWRVDNQPASWTQIRQA